MAFELQLALRGQLRAYMDAEKRNLIGAENAVIRRRTEQTKQRLRRNVVRAFVTTNRLPFLIRSSFLPATFDHGAVGQVWSIWVVKQRGVAVDLFEAFERRQVIQAEGAEFLVVPAPGNRTANRRALLAGAQLVPFYQQGQSGRIARTTSTRRRRRQRTPVGYVVFQGSQLVAVLLRIVKLKRRSIHIDREFERAERGLDELVVREAERRLARVAAQFKVAA